MNKSIIEKSNWQLWKATISYQGTYYDGWQSQPNKRGIQDIIEAVLYKIFRQRQRITGASRTDAGVHAFGQVFTFYAPSIIPAPKLQEMINGSLPDTLLIRELVPVPESFHPRFMAKKKIYQYIISPYKTIPSINFFIHHEKKDFDPFLLKEALLIFIGKHDFRSFAFESKEKNTIRTIYDIDIKEYNNLYIITIVGNGFLRYMIRRLLGGALYASQKKDIGYLKDIFKKKNSSNHLTVMPSKGLMLKNIIYDENEPINYQNPFLIPFINKI